jgi:hypothetical protein
MEDSFVLKIALLTSFAGLILLFIFSNVVELDKTMIVEIDDFFVGKKILVEGRIDWIKETTKTYSLQLSDSSGYIRATIFDKESFSFGKGDLIIAEGRVDEYLGYQTILIDKLSSSLYVS